MHDEYACTGRFAHDLPADAIVIAGAVRRQASLQTTVLSKPVGVTVARVATSVDAVLAATVPAAVDVPTVIDCKHVRVRTKQVKD